MSAPSYAIVGLGELIWDVLPRGKQLGGAPTNFAYISRLLGDEALVASRIGADELGSEARTRLERSGVVTSYLQTDGEHPTGTVGVRVDERGEAIFRVNENSAWDYLEWTPQWEELAGRARVVCFGTLGQRAPQSRAVIQRFLRQTQPGALRLFDVNLRHSFFTPDMLAASLELSSVVKLNSEELPRVAAMLELEVKSQKSEVRDSTRATTGESEGEGERVFAERLIELFALQLVAVTRGAQGSLLVTPDEASEHKGFRAPVADTIGAGDAFAATLAHGWLRGAPLESLSAAANRMAAWVVTRSGATPPPEAQVISAVQRDLGYGQ